MRAARIESAWIRVRSVCKHGDEQRNGQKPRARPQCLGDPRPSAPPSAACTDGAKQAGQARVSVFLPFFSLSPVSISGSRSRPIGVCLLFCLAFRSSHLTRRRAWDLAADGVPILQQCFSLEQIYTCFSCLNLSLPSSLSHTPSGRLDPAAVRSGAAAHPTTWIAATAGSFPGHRPQLKRR
jgi:hypothetical protein